MYRPKHFEQNDPAALAALMRAHPLAAVVSVSPDGPTANHTPLEFSAAAGKPGLLRGHLARANPLWQQAAGQSVLAIFGGENAYVSPSFYPSKARLAADRLGVLQGLAQGDAAAQATAALMQRDE